MPSGRRETDSDVTTSPARVGLESTVAPVVSGEAATVAPTYLAPVSGDAPTVGPVRGDEPTVAPATSAQLTAGATLAPPTIGADANDLPDLPVVDGGLYTIGTEIGRGGMGRVLAARDRRLRRDVVIKVLNPGAATPRFQREALITARLQHPSIVRVYDAGWLGGEQPFYAMERVRGQSLDRKVAAAEDARERLALLPHVIAIADALAYAHSEHVIHRDLKPQNVLVGSFGETVVIDWGLAKDLRVTDLDSFEPRARVIGADDQTVAGSVMGTPAFMPPEQARGEPADERSDVYAIGAILYTVLSGATPVSGDRALEDASAGAITPLREREPDVPPELASIVERAMAFAPHERYASAKELADELRRYANGQLVASHVYSTGTLIRRWMRRHRAAIAVAATALIVLAVVATVGIRRIVDERARAEASEREAIRQRERVEEERDTLVVHQANRVVESDPSSALAWLRQLSPKAMANPAVQAVANAAAANHVGFELDGPTDDVEHLVLGKRDTAFTGSDDGHLWGWSIPSRRGDDLGHHAGPIESIAIADNGLALATGGTDTTVHVWDLVTGESKVLVGHTGAVRGVAFAPDGTRFASAGQDKALWIWSVATGEGKPMIKDSHALRPVTWSRDGGRVWTGTADGRLLELDVATGKVTATSIHHDELRAMALSPDGTRLATGGEDGAVFVITLAGKRAHKLATHADVVRDVAWTRDGTRVVSAGGDTLVRVTTLDGKRLALEGNTSGVKDVAISPDDTLVASAGIDGVVRVWPIAGGPARAFRGHRASVKSVAFTDDNGTLLSTSDDDRVRLWPLAAPPPAPAGAGLAAWIATYTNVTVAKP